MTTLAGSPYNGGGLSASNALSGAAASSRIIRTIAGTNRLYYEMAYGQTIAGSPQCSPRRPCGGVGHDHTGGYMGKAFTHTIFSAAFTPRTGPDSGNYVLAPGLNCSASPVMYSSTSMTWYVPIPACPVTNGAYLSLTVGYSVYVPTYTSSFGLLGKVYTGATGYDDGDGTACNLTISDSGYSSHATATVPFIAGTVNRVDFRMTTTTDAETVLDLAAFHISQTA